MTYDEVRHFADSWGLIVMVAMFLLFIAWPFRKGARHDCVYPFARVLERAAAKQRAA